MRIFGIKIEYLYLFFVFDLVVNGESKFNKTKTLGIKKLSSCKAELDDGRLIDLTSLDRQRNPRSTIGGFYEYKFNPCSPVQCVKGTLPTAAVCQVALNVGTSVNCGEQNDNYFTYDGEVFKIYYLSGTKTSVVNCLCGEFEEFSFSSESPFENYNFVFTSKCCCPDGCSGRKPDDGDKSGLSFGTVLLIIFIVLLFVYFVGGFIFLKFVKNASGTDTIPNFNFWVSIPSDIKRGVTFTVSKIRGDQSNNYSNL